MEMSLNNQLNMKHSISSFSKHLVHSCDLKCCTELMNYADVCLLSRGYSSMDRVTDGLLC